MNSFLRCAVAALSVAAIAATVPAVAADNMSSSMMAASSMTVKLTAQNGSGESGTAVLKDVTGGVSVVIALKGAPATAQPAHIHTGSCPKPGDVKFPLTNVVNGASKTTVKGTTIAALLASPMSINVHESAADLQKYVACGDIAK
jgi:Cu/Zn superoxide dismutase